MLKLCQHEVPISTEGYLNKYMVYLPVRGHNGISQLYLLARGNNMFIESFWNETIKITKNEMVPSTEILIMEY